MNKYKIRTATTYDTSSASAIMFDGVFSCLLWLLD